MKLYTLLVEDGGYYASIDRYGAYNKGALPYRNGQGITAPVNASVEMGAITDGTTRGLGRS